MSKSSQGTLLTLVVILSLVLTNHYCHANIQHGMTEYAMNEVTYDFSNTVNISDASGNGLVNYPLQIGRPFLKGEIPTGFVPGVKLNGMLLDSQA